MLKWYSCDAEQVWITRTCDDVSTQVLEVARVETDPLTRANKIRDRCRELEKAAEVSSPGMRSQVKEMSADKSYVLFTFERLRDVRIVYVPPNALVGPALVHQTTTIQAVHICTALHSRGVCN